MNSRDIIVLHQKTGENPAPDEKDTLVQAEFVCSALNNSGYTARTLAAGLDLENLHDRLLDTKPDAVFNLVESLNGKGSLIHLVPSLLSSMNIPYTGASAEAIMLTSNKLSAKHILKEHRLPTPEWQPLKKTSEIRLKAPFIAKSVWEHASLSINDSSVFFEQIESAADICNRSDSCFLEKFIPGREFNISILEMNGKPFVLPLAEIDFSSFPGDKLQIVNYAAKWDENSFEYSNTPRIFINESKEPNLSANLKILSIRCWEVFRLSGYARIDMRMDRQGQLWILEVNTNPCLSPDAGFMAAAVRAGMSDQKVICSIIESISEAVPCLS